MAQPDYVIDNQSGLAFRADLNNNLAAIVSQNSGATAPAPPMRINGGRIRRPAC